MTALKSKAVAFCMAGILLATVATGCTPQNSNGDLRWLVEFAAEWARAWLAAWIL